MNVDEQFLLDSYKQMDAIKTAIISRRREIYDYTLTGRELQLECWLVWRMTMEYLDSLRRLVVEEDGDDPPARYVPPEVAHERTERLQAMDAKLKEILGDSVDEEPGDEFVD